MAEPAKEPNWLEKFQAFWKALSRQEQHAAYDVLAMVRGPDDGAWNETPDRKYLATARIRFLLFGGEYNVNTDGQPLTDEELANFQNGHYKSHAADAQARLVRIGVWQTPVFLEKYVDDTDDSDDSDSDDDLGDDDDGWS